MNKINQLFLQLLQVALGRRSELDRALNAEEWEAIYEMAKTQSQLGVIMTAFACLPKDQWPPRMMLFKWAPQAKQVEEEHAKHVEVLTQVHEALANAKIDHVFMKGLTCGARYPKPESRTCGDIDYLVSSDDFARTLDVMDVVGRVDRSLVHEHHGMAHVGKVTLEPHYKLHNYQNTKNDVVMQEMVKEIIPAEIRWVKIGKNGVKDGAVKVPVLPMEFEGMFLISHMVNHVYEEGLGLRQVIDFMMWAMDCAASLDFNKEKHANYLNRMRMLRAHRIFVRICEKYLGMSTEIFGYDYSAKEKSFADKMLRDIMRVGNFGRGEYEFHRDGKWGDLQNYMWVTRRALTLGFLCPSEAYMWPVSKFVRYFDKKLHPGRYKEPQ